MPAGAAGLSFLHVDRWLLAADKPAGLLAVPGRGPDKADCLARRAQAEHPDALVVHRLDMATSGLMLLARGADMQRALSQAFAQRQVHKRYVAVVHGLPAAEAGEITWPLAADWPQRPRQRVDLQHGRPALTRWGVLQRDAHSGHTRLWLEPVTGRSHQLRVHLAALGHAIVGDPLYGPPDGALRLMLHAESVTLQHPALGLPLSLHCPAPF